MRIRSIITIAAVAATALIATAGAASAATTDVNGVVTVSKGEIMAQFPGMNEAAFQRIAMAPGESLTGSNVFTATTDHRVRLLRRQHVPAALPQHHHHQPDRAHRDLQRLGQQGHRLDPRCQGCERHHREQHGRHPLPELRHHLCRHGTVTNSPRHVGAEPQRRDVVHLQRHARQHRGQPVRGPGRLIHRTTQQPVPLRRGGLFSCRPGPAA